MGLFSDLVCYDLSVPEWVGPIPRVMVFFVDIVRGVSHSVWVGPIPRVIVFFCGYC